MAAELAPNLHRTETRGKVSFHILTHVRAGVNLFTSGGIIQARSPFFQHRCCGGALDHPPCPWPPSGTFGNPSGNSQHPRAQRNPQRSSGSSRAPLGACKSPPPSPLQPLPPSLSIPGFSRSSAPLTGPASLPLILLTISGGCPVTRAPRPHKKCFPAGDTRIDPLAGVSGREPCVHDILVCALQTASPWRTGK